MIINPGKFDKSDVVWLLAAMVKANKKKYGLPEGETFRVDVDCVGVFHDIACDAMSLVYQLQRQPEAAWDCVVWQRWLSDAGEDSLADRLVTVATQSIDEDDPPEMDALCPVVQGWLADKGI